MREDKAVCVRERKGWGGEPMGEKGKGEASTSLKEEGIFPFSEIL